MSIPRKSSEHANAAQVEHVDLSVDVPVHVLVHVPVGYMYIPKSSGGRRGNRCSRLSQLLLKSCARSRERLQRVIEVVSSKLVASTSHAVIQ